MDQAAAAGIGTEIEEYAERRTIQVPYDLISPYKPEKLKAVYVSGDSMIDGKINDQDIVIFFPGQTQGNGIYVLSIGTILLVKRVEFDSLSGTVILISANSAYAPRVIQGEDINSIKIEGRVIACLHRY
jgi:SOS-response transcriptional repressor LexA